jgi:hypothetical protein
MAQQRYQRVLASGRQARGDEQSSDLVAIQASGVGLVVEARAANVLGR